jgi:hypothetical protein
MEIRRHQKHAVSQWFCMRARHLIFVAAVCIVCFLLASPAGTAEPGEEACPKPYIKTIFPWVAKPGDLVKIQGQGFGVQRGEVVFTEGVNSPMELIFAPSVKAEIVSWTYRRIWVIVPKSAATGHVFVRIPCGAESNKKDFTVQKKK